jgi:biotin carboxylase
MTRPRVLLIGGKLATVEAAAAADLDIVYLQKPQLFDPRARDYCVQVHLLDYQDLPLVSGIVRALHAAEPLNRVMTQAEAGLLVAGHLTTELGLPGTGLATARSLHDKAELRRVLNAAGLGPVAAERGTTRSALRRFVERHGAAVVKPVAASGSLGVRKVTHAGAVDAAWDWVSSFGLGDFLVEELLAGVEVSVETYSVGGMHTVLAVTGKDTGDGVIELGHVVPAALTGDQDAVVADFTRRVLDEVGLVDGLAHTELMLTATGPRVIEAHNRRGGGRIADLVRLVYGVDMLRLGFGLAHPDPPAPVRHPPRGAAAVRFLVAEPGQVVAIDGVERAAALDGVLDIQVDVRPGDIVRPAQWSEDRCGQVLVRAGDTASAVALARRAAELVRIRTVPSAGAAPLAMPAILDLVGEVLWPAGLDPGREPAMTGRTC